MSELEPEGKVRKTRNIIINTICILLAVSGIVWVVHFFWHYSRYEVTNDALVEQYITPVNVRIQGYIQSVRFAEHQFVKAGDTLIVIDNREYKIKVMDAQAALMDAEASANVLHANVSTTRSNISVSDANLQEAQARLQKLKQDEQRYANLLKEESVSNQQYEQVKTDYEAAKARYNALLQQKKSTQLISEEANTKVTSGQANILRKKAELEMTQLNLSYTVILAPYDGYMGRRNIEEGQLVQPGQVLGNIIRNDAKWVTANYKETQIGNIYIGQDVSIKIDALKNKKFTGKVTAISEATGSKFSLIPVDNSAGNFVKIQQRIPVKIEFQDISIEDLKKLKAGMMVETEAKIQ